MEIFSMTLTMDVLQMMQPSNNLHVQYIAERDAANTQLLIFDDEPDGPYFYLWSLFAKKQVVRLKNLSENTTLENIIVPLPGGSNTLWQGDWEINPCEGSTNLNTFANLVLDLYGIEKILPRQNDKIIFTFINRVSGRRLVDMEEYLDQLSKMFPQVKIQSIDFAAISYKDQLQIIQNTDIFAGIHGAGLTHGIFLPPGSAMVEILPYNLNHKGFRNLAALRGHEYFSIHASLNSHPIEKRGWNGDDVHIEIERFLDVMSVAIKSMYNKGLRNYGID
ncbi:uncharacterized protein N7483_009099 [Penicillium malachiteum]|uniref:uncharacterized protein n=1 Tax=Penicillium malachiteum TaxID=1324776 RepID=UPI002548F523|nr:uncharacterized protein N7483_009099 [Penicillium malachiteum]KAJ5721165.1 hypothetical protein N7483_009099 [Penicillium malachiteum]